MIYEFKKQKSAEWFSHVNGFISYLLNRRASKQGFIWTRPLRASKLLCHSNITDWWSFWEATISDIKQAVRSWLHLEDDKAPKERCRKIKSWLTLRNWSTRAFFPPKVIWAAGGLLKALCKNDESWCWLIQSDMPNYIDCLGNYFKCCKASSLRCKTKRHGDIPLWVIRLSSGMQAPPLVSSAPKRKVR